MRAEHTVRPHAEGGTGPQAPSGRQFTRAFGDQRATVVEVGASVRAYRDGDRDVLHLRRGRDAGLRARRPTHPLAQPFARRPVPVRRRRLPGGADGAGDLEIYTADTLSPERRRRGLGVEPMTCPPNAFGDGVRVLRLEPGESVTTTWGARLDPVG